MCVFRVLCYEFFIIPIAPKFLHHYSMKENEKGGWISLTGITDKGIIDPFTTSYKDFKGHFFRVCPEAQSKLIYLT